MKDIKQVNGTKLLGWQVPDARARMVRERFLEEVTFERRTEGGKGGHAP